MSYLGMDVGTSGCKAVVFNAQGRLLAHAHRAYRVSSPRAGWAELDSEQVCRACLDVLREAASACASDPVRALAVSSQGEAFTPVDSAGRVLAHAQVSSDTRAADLARDWSAEFGRERLYRITGHTAHPMFTLPKLLWLRDNQPQVWAQAARFLCFEDLLHTRLGVEPAMGWPLAGRTMLFDVRRHVWDEGILRRIGLDPARLARTLPSGAVVGSVPRRAGEELGFSREVLVVAGGHDQPVSALGGGIIAPGMAAYATGTTECITPAFAAPAFSAELFQSNLCTYDFALPGMYATVAFSLTGGNILNWFCDQFGAAETAEAVRTGVSAYELLLRELGPEPSPLLVLPYFTPSGTPYFDPHTTGAILGLRLTTTRGEVLRALLEGVAFEMRLNLDILQRSGVAIRELRATGGGARNAAWNQLKADVLDTPITSVAVTEAGALGAALLAAAADCSTPPQALAKEWVRTGAVFEPDAKRAAHYRARFEEYKRLYPALKALRCT
ncbi:MAG: FGGY family carbohydrate kinase [Planctomycetota bacterium]|nr:FGGY family carbohydrate kinase [Planctomycetota bacterium]